MSDSVPGRSHSRSLSLPACVSCSLLLTSWFATVASGNLRRPIFLLDFKHSCYREVVLTVSNKIFFATILTPVVLIYTTTFIGEICLVRQQNTPEDRDDANVSAGPEIRAAHVEKESGLYRCCNFDARGGYRRQFGHLQRR